MELAALLLGVTAIYTIGGWSAWWVNSRIELGSVSWQPARIYIRVFVAMIVFIAVTAPLVYGLRPIFG
jgi:hypothetical protein